jgi:hypothetical protein
MGLTTINALFGGPWGIVESRRVEIESGSHGTFDRIYAQEVSRNFLPIQVVAGLFDCHESTARHWLRKRDARFIACGLSHRYYLPDVEKTKIERQSPREPAA